MSTAPVRIADIEKFPEVNSGFPYILADPIQHWTGASELPPGTAIPPGVIWYPCIDPDPTSPTAGKLIMKSIQASQYYGPPNIPDTGAASQGESANTLNPPPIDVVKYNALQSEGEKVVLGLFGEQIVPIAPAAAAPSGPVATTSDATIQQIASNVSTLLSDMQLILAKLPS